MQIRTLGVRGEILLSKHLYARHSGLLIDNTILCDIGEKEYLQYDPVCILITHLHPDHAFFVRGKDVSNIDIPIVAPEAFARQPHMKIISAPFTQNGYTIIPIPTVHSTKVKSQGYVISKENKKIFYTGDMISIPVEYHGYLKGLDAVITEASFFRKGGIVRKDADGRLFGHAGIPDLVDFFEKYTHRIIFTHFGTWFLKDPAEGIRKITSLGKDGLLLETAFDGKEFMI
ncbi:MAG: hypothetical protein JO154_11040 [Chitinophaga sp.]|uniref:MBL fold metallo-hydrolase n=1 Tax=Chitinophaga sp. TaxID=1869181 RepID=UPI0025B90561|nr:MBL fold metallo-hydrolase [Chitinophaga sp.]MBV8253133.1 hypothetical protein [Chitinophaga sp.]